MCVVANQKQQSQSKGQSFVPPPSPILSSSLVYTGRPSTYFLPSLSPLKSENASSKRSSSALGCSLRRPERERGGGGGGVEGGVGVESGRGKAGGGGGGISVLFPPAKGGENIYI